MRKFLEILLEKLAHGCIARVATTIQSTLAALEVARQAEDRRELEELARQYESSGMPQIAAFIRSRCQSLADLPTDLSDATRLSDAAASHPNIRCADPAQNSVAAESPAKPARLHRTANRPKRRKANVDRAETGTAEPNETESTPATSDLFFPLQATPPVNDPDPPQP